MEFTFLPLLLVFGALLYFSSRRQRKAMQATIDLQESLRVGDRIHTTSGLQGTIVGISDESIDLEIAPGVVTTWMKLAVRDRIEPAVAPLEEGLEQGYDVGDVTRPTQSTPSGQPTEITESTGSFGPDGDIEPGRS